MDRLWKDLSYAVRVLLKRPGLSTIIIVTLAIGIGLTYGVFCIVNGALYKGLPFHEADRLMVLGRTDTNRNIDFMGVSVHDYEDWTAQQTTFAGLAALNTGDVNLSGNDRRPVRYQGAFVSAKRG